MNTLRTSTVLTVGVLLIHSVHTDSVLSDCTGVVLLIHSVHIDSASDCTYCRGSLLIHSVHTD